MPRCSNQFQFIHTFMDRRYRIVSLHPPPKKTSPPTVIHSGEYERRSPAVPAGSATLSNRSAVVAAWLWTVAARF
jgi:hypothetical protein